MNTINRALENRNHFANYLNKTNALANMASTTSPALKVTLDRTNGIINEEMKSLTDSYKRTVSAITPSSASFKKGFSELSNTGNSIN
ncbi:hypothetical protein [Lactobacillus sp. ESL0228]|uniref:hypothetical protein n=1 Tax=Lactobacillus sp. ESL0228 TaxID=2069352 RepID=UPI000EFCD3A2|nr:hypothetical protein [Lactobacillus sp. ESL0228]RMC48929.1 hypothetical protein F5ESL0228_04880 [Lactobacillus sp. ESL0228]